MNAVIQTPPTPLVGVGRNVIFRTRGYAHGPVVRMVSPSDVGKMIKPFVFLDLVDTQEAIGQQGFGWHPHSGIATLTLAMEGQGRYVESIGREGTMVAGDIEWMNAGRGVWHSGFAVPQIRPLDLGPTRMWRRRLHRVEVHVFLAFRTVRSQFRAEAAG